MTKFKKFEMKAIDLAKKTGKDPVDFYIELAHPKIVCEYSDEVFVELKRAGYSFAAVDNDLNLMTIRDKKRRLPILLSCRYVFTEANIVVADVKKFFSEAAKRHFPKLYENLEKIEKMNKDREKLIKKLMSANGIIIETNNEKEVEKLMKKFSCKGVDNFNIETGEGTFFHSFLLRVAIDDYDLFAFVTNEKKEKSDLLKFLDVKNMILREDFTNERVCWVCGNTFKFEDIDVDNKDESVTEQIERLIEMWRDRFCGC